MHLSYTTITGVTTAILSISVLPLTVARPTSGSERGGVAVREALSLGAHPEILQNKHQRIYRSDDEHLDLAIREAANAPHLKRALVAPRGGVRPKINYAKILGDSPANPASKFINKPAAPLPTLPTDLYLPKINTALTKDSQYSQFYNGSGSLSLTPNNEKYLEDMQAKPRLHRDNGLGGKVSGHNIFIFADTISYTQTGKWTGFVSNSVASNHGAQAKTGEPPVLHDKLGEFANNMGTMRNWIPFTDGEAAFNAKMAGQGQRYAIWPSSSLINIDDDSALLYAPLLFTNTAGGTDNDVTFVGTTVSKVTVPGPGGAIAERLSPLLFPVADGVEWGADGGIRSFGTNKAYIFGTRKGGLMLGRVDVSEAANASAYEFWHSDGSWSSTAPGKDSKDIFVNAAISNVDIFYSPLHSTFLMVFMTPYADNKLYWRYLQTSTPIKPSAGEDIVENITKHPWSEPELLLNLPKPAGASYAYSGGMHRGYFDDEDITKGGAKMLVSWTQPNGHAANSPETGYNHMTAEIHFA